VKEKTEIKLPELTEEQIKEIKKIQCERDKKYNKYKKCVNFGYKLGYERANKQLQKKIDELTNEIEKQDRLICKMIEKHVDLLELKKER